MWKTICNFNQYTISDKGEIKSYKRNKEGYIMKKQEDKDGYFKVSLYKEGKYTRMFIHRLVMMTFNPVKKMEKLQVNHLDGDKKNNDINNLEWCTHKENIKHAINMGLKNSSKGVNNFNVKLTKEDVKKVVKLRENFGMTHLEIANKFNMSRRAIGNILNGVTWSHVTGIEKESVK